VTFDQLQLQAITVRPITITIKVGNYNYDYFLCFTNKKTRTTVVSVTAR